MNSEELEISLRTEFENYLKDAFAEMKQELSQLQEKVETELNKHKDQLDVVFQDTFSRFHDGKELDAGFRESVIEHLRLARDEGARITVTAMDEAERLEKPALMQESDSQVATKIRDAFNEISGKGSQSEILKALVKCAEDFAPRGAFFIIKNEHFVGWRTFGKEKGESDEAIREVFFPMSANSILSDAIKSGNTKTGISGVYDDSEIYLDKIKFEKPEKMVAVPLVVRGRGVAALYADTGNNAGRVDQEALESLVKIASLTVELLASARNTPAVKAEVSEKATASVPVSNIQDTGSLAGFVTETVSSPTPEFSKVEEVSTEEPEKTTAEEVEVQENFVADDDGIETVSVKSEFEDSVPSFSSEPIVERNDSESISTPDYSDYQTDTWSNQEVSYQTDSFQGGQEVSAVSDVGVQTNEYQFEQPAVSDYSFETKPSFETPANENFNNFSTTESFTKTETFAQESFDPAPISKPNEVDSLDFENKAPVSEPVIETPIQTAAAPAQAKTRFSERNVDLPIEVADDERRLHNDARRFARLLVSEIKLYNEQKVKEGRESSNLYEVLREAIDRSREMYDKRVQPPVVAKFDYFHYELVNTLAEGDENKLGGSYPGAAV